MKRRTKIRLFGLAAVTALAGVVLSQFEPLAIAWIKYRYRSVTVSLPRCNRVDVFQLDGQTSGQTLNGFPVRPYHAYSQILNRTVLTGVEAESLAELWRSQLFDPGYQAMCHLPGFGLRFYRDSSLKFETSVCFHCSNFYVTTLGKSYWEGFAEGTKEGKELLKQLQGLFPEVAPNPPDE